jgi:uncharacterized protein
VEPTAVEIRVLGCLLEKQHTTPDAYPLTLNALRVACNQTTNRDPVVDYDEATIRDALRRLAERRWTRVASGAGSRAAKYRHLLDQALDLDDAELAVIAVLMLRGAQTPGELKQRSERLHGFTDLAAVQAALDGLVERGYVARHERRPGQKELRYEQLLGVVGEDGPPVSGGEAGIETDAEVPAGGQGEGEPPREPDLVPAEDRLTRLEREVTALRSELTSLRDALGESG